MTKIYRNKKYDSFLYLVSGIICSLATIVFTLPSIPLDIKDIVGLIFMIIVILMCFVLFLFYHQTVIFNKEGIKFKNLLFCKKIVRWSDVQKITIINKKTYTTSNGYNAYYNWIKFITDGDEKKKIFNIPNEILYTKENLDIVYKFANEYNDKIQFEGITPDLSDKPTGGWFK